MARVTGRRVPLTSARRGIVELMALSAGVPAVTVERTMDLRALAAARDALPAPPSWTALFAKGFAQVAAARPDLRRCYVAWPRPHLYEHAQSVAAVTVERDHQGEPCVFFASLPGPDLQPLEAVQAALAGFKVRPVGEVRPFRRLLRYAALPWPVRGWVWRWGYHSSGRSRARHFGTFGLTSTAGLGATLERLVTPLTATLTYGPVAADGRVSVRLAFDHRVLDGGPAARALRELEERLTTGLVGEVRAYRAAAIE